MKSDKTMEKVDLGSGLQGGEPRAIEIFLEAGSYTHFPAHETLRYLLLRPLP